MDYRVKVAIALGVCALNCVLIGKDLSKKKVFDECLAESRKSKRVYRDIYGNEKYTWIVSDDVK